MFTMFCIRFSLSSDSNRLGGDSIVLYFVFSAFSVFELSSPQMHHSTVTLSACAWLRSTRTLVADMVTGTGDSVGDTRL